MPSAKKKKGGSKALTLKKKGPTEKQKKAVRNAVSQQKKNIEGHRQSNDGRADGGTVTKG